MATQPISMSPSEKPNLAPPGAGLPFFQKIFLRYLLAPFFSKINSWKQLEEKFLFIHSRILSKIISLSESQLNQKILIKPLLGLEDSSRFWSIAMTLEHLIIVGTGIRQGIILLSQNKSIQTVVKIENFKPGSQLTGKEAVLAFKNFADNTLQKIHSELGSKKSNTNHNHPWFGPLNCHQWFWLLSVHAKIHERQITKILEKLSEPDS